MRAERAPTEESSQADDLASLFKAFVADASFPCVGAKSALSRGGLTVGRARNITSAWDDLQIYAQIKAFVIRHHADPQAFRSLVILFDGPTDLDEPSFEQALWARAQSLSDKDVWLGEVQNSEVASDVEDPRFALSFCGEAFFLVGLHPGASRPARRFTSPAIVFNPHEQFQQLRASGRYESMRRAIIRRDVALSGSENPMLARFGEMSEARQYSGRAVDAGWRCPFSSKARKLDDT